MILTWAGRDESEISDGSLLEFSIYDKINYLLFWFPLLLVHIQNYHTVTSTQIPVFACNIVIYLRNENMYLQVGRKGCVPISVLKRFLPIEAFLLLDSNVW